MNALASTCIDDLSHLAAHHEAEAARIRSAISTLCDVYGVDASDAAGADPFGVNEMQPETAHEPGDGSQPSPSAGSSRRANVSTGVTAGETAPPPSAMRNGCDGASEGQGATGAGTAGETPATGANHSDIANTISPEPPASQPGSEAVADDAGAAPVGEVLPSASPTPILSKREHVRLTHEAHPDWTAAQVADHLGLSSGAVRGHASSLGITFPPASRKGERNEAVVRRKKVAALHRKMPWLTSYEASARLLMPEGNLRIASQELGIEWGQGGRPASAEPAVPTEAPGRTKLDRVRLMHRQHPTWTARMIANALGEKVTTVSTLLAAVRGESRV